MCLIYKNHCVRLLTLPVHNLIKFGFDLPTDVSANNYSASILDSRQSHVFPLACRYDIYCTLLNESQILSRKLKAIFFFFFLILLNQPIFFGTEIRIKIGLVKHIDTNYLENTFLKNWINYARITMINIF